MSNVHLTNRLDERFGAYVQRCFSHKIIDFCAKNAGNSTFSESYKSTFSQLWQEYDPTKSGLINSKDLLMFMHDLAEYNYASNASLTTRHKAQFISFFGGPKEAVSMKDFACYIERHEFEERVEDDESQSKSIANTMASKTSIPIMSRYSLGHCLGHVAVDLGVDPLLATQTGGLINQPYILTALQTAKFPISNIDKDIRDRLVWYASSWLQICSDHYPECNFNTPAMKLPKLPWSQVKRLLKQAVRNRKYSRFVSTHANSKWNVRCEIEAAAMLKVRSLDAMIDLMDFCTVVESPERNCNLLQVSLTARVCVVSPWNRQIHPLFTKDEKEIVKTILLIVNRLAVTEDVYNTQSHEHTHQQHLQCLSPPPIEVWFTHILGCGQWLSHPEQHST